MQFQAFNPTLLQKITIPEIVPDIQRGHLQFPDILHKAGSRTGQSIIGIEPAVFGRHTGSCPTIVKHPLVHIVLDIHILYFIHQGLVVILTAQFVIERRIYTKTFILEVKAKGTAQFRLFVAYDHLIFSLPSVNHFSVQIQEHFFSGSRIDSQGTYRPDCIHRLAFGIPYRGFGYAGIFL